MTTGLWLARGVEATQTPKVTDPYFFTEKDFPMIPSTVFRERGTMREVRSIDGGEKPDTTSGEANTDGHLGVRLDHMGIQEEMRDHARVVEQ